MHTDSFLCDIEYVILFFRQTESFIRFFVQEHVVCKKSYLWWMHRRIVVPKKTDLHKLLTFLSGRKWSCSDVEGKIYIRNG